MYLQSHGGIISIEERKGKRKKKKIKTFRCPHDMLFRGNNFPAAFIVFIIFYFQKFIFMLIVQINFLRSLQ